MLRRTAGAWWTALAPFGLRGRICAVSRLLPAATGPPALRAQAGRLAESRRDMGCTLASWARPKTGALRVADSVRRRAHGPRGHPRTGAALLCGPRASYARDSTTRGTGERGSLATRQPGRAAMSPRPDLSVAENVTVATAGCTARWRGAARRATRSHRAPVYAAIHRSSRW